MTPRRLLPILGIFLVLAGAYFLLEWHSGKKAKEKEEAQKLFAVKEGDITAVTLKRGSEEIRLVREGKDWRLAHPLQDRTDGVAMNSLLTALAYLRPDRHLGEEKDLKPFGLDQPSLVVTFAAGGKNHTLTVGRKTPGGQGFYARRDQEPQVLVIAATSKESLDRPLSALRDRMLFDFAADQVKGLRVKRGNAQVDLEKTDQTWRWLSRPHLKINPDRLERLLRYVSLARVKDFVADAPKELRAYGLSPPAVELTVLTDKGEQRLSLGARKKNECYARQGEGGPLVLTEDLLLDLFTTPLESVAGLKTNPQWSQVRGAFPQYLEDRRLWTGEVRAVSSLTWGPPGKTWTAAKDKDFYQLTGPDKQEVRQPAVRLELALLKLQDLESERLVLPDLPETRVLNFVELREASGKTLFRLEELGAAAGKVEVRFSLYQTPPQRALVSQEAYRRWQKDLEQLSSPPSS